MPVNNGRSTPTQRGAKRIYENIFDRYTDKKYMYVYIYINTFTPTYLHTYPICTLVTSLVNITNYVEISFQSVSDPVLVQQQQHVTSRNRSQPVESWSVGTSRNRVETVGTNRKKRRKKKTVGTSQNWAEPVRTGQSACFLFFFGIKCSTFSDRLQ